MKLRLRCAVVTAVGIAAFAGCNGARSQSPIGVLPVSPPSQMQRLRFHRFLAPEALKADIYVSSFHGTSVLGFKSGDRRGRGPNCLEYIGRNRHLNFIATDPAGNLIVPEGSPHQVVVYGGPGMCGPELGTFHDRYGQPAAAASFDAVSGTILIADIVGPHRGQVGNIAVCTLKSGCTKMLTNPNIIGYGTGVALAKSGDCWLSSERTGSPAVAMTYWPRCTGRGEAATGLQGESTGSLSIDQQGNLVSVDWKGGGTGQLWVYSGCNPACMLVGGPFPLQGRPACGAFNATGDQFGVMEEGLIGIVDIYNYSPTKLTYEYSFDSGIATSDPLGFAYSPASNQ
jgi:hypothetical protein